ncbi:MAG: Bacterial regulatory protein luxR family [Acidobacteriota bacterium]|jgi:DNA-binding CsgD family transcriptional regulator/PAS domain-containing protein|nr:Bacterial regulatory protein luxR family [Acidobacteriota bacterium]
MRSSLEPLTGTDPREYLKATDVAAIFGLAELVYLATREPLAWQQVGRELDRIAAALKEKYQYALVSLADLLHDLAAARSTIPVDRNLPRSRAARAILLPADDVYFAIASLLPPDHPHYPGTPPHGVTTTAKTLLLRRILEPAVVQALEQRLTLVQTRLTASQLKSCVEGSSQGVLTFSAAGQCVFYNPAVCSIFGIGAEGFDAWYGAGRLPTALRHVVRRAATLPVRTAQWLERITFEAAGRTLHAFPFVVPGGHDGMTDPLLHLFVIAEPDAASLVREVQREAALSTREAAVLQLIVEGLSFPAIARKLGLSTQTVNTYAERCAGKLHVSGREEMIKRVYSRLPTLGPA